MNKSFKFFLALILPLLFIADSCKKGPNDPFLSFRSRTARLSGDWTLTKYTETTVQGSTTTTTTYDGANIVSTTNGGITSVPYTYKVSFVSDGTYTSTEVANGITTVTNGNWFWLGKNKSVPLKNKEAFIMTTSKSTSGPLVITQTGFSDQNVSKFNTLDELKNKEMVITVNYADGLDTKKGTYTFTQN